MPPSSSASASPCGSPRPIRSRPPADPPQPGPFFRSRQTCGGPAPDRFRIGVSNMNLNATLIVQAIVFIVLGWVTMKFIWPPLIRALDERRQKIADGLAAADEGTKSLTEA